MTAEALQILEGLPIGWDWSINKDHIWYHIVISNRGLMREPVYTNADMNKGRKTSNPEKKDLLACVKFAYNEYLKGEKLAA